MKRSSTSSSLSGLAATFWAGLPLHRLGRLRQRLDDRGPTMGGFMRSDSAFDTRYLRLIGCLGALVMASEAGAGALFSLPTNFPAGDFPFSVAVADLDDDTLPDVVTANNSSSDVSVLLDNGDGTFQATVSFATGDECVVLADLDGDTVLDLVTANLKSDDVSVLLGNGDGTFQLAVSFATGDSPFAVVVADLDGDAASDLVITHFDTDYVTVLFNLPGPPQLLLTCLPFRYQ